MKWNKNEKKLTIPSDEDSSKPRKAGIAGGVVLMSSGPGNHSFRDGELPCPEARFRAPLLPRRGLPRLTRRPEILHLITVHTIKQRKRSITTQPSYHKKNNNNNHYPKKKVLMENGRERNRSA